jgi:thiamine-phosphate pyrophosphorylase
MLPQGLLHSAPVHDAREIAQANQVGADLYFLSPIFATRSHPGQRPLNPLQALRLSALCLGPVVYLGGMNRNRYRTHKSRLTHGWAAIDALR